VPASGAFEASTAAAAAATPSDGDVAAGAGKHH
jgi:hypothetical protein